jgi:hypothetical protein
MIPFLAMALPALAVQNDQAQANGYDDAWEAAWVAHCRSIYTSTGKNTGMVLQVGDSITHSNAYNAWPRYGAGQTAEDQQVLAWYNAFAYGPASPPDAANTNGYYLTAVDIGSRGMTSSGGITTGEFLSGAGNGGPDMPGASDLATGRTNVADTAITGNLHVDSVAWAFSNAQFAVVMLGTNDVGGSVATGTFGANLASIVDKLEARNIVVVLSTIPPRVGSDVSAYNGAIRSLAQSRGLPLIDFHDEILARRSGTSWQGTLIDSDGIHPTGGVSGATPASDPYEGGDAALHRTGTHATNSGYLLRAWLTVQKLKEVKTYVADGVDPPGGGGGGSGSGGSSGDEGCSCGSAFATPGVPWAGLAALASIGFLVTRRRVR